MIGVGRTGGVVVCAVIVLVSGLGVVAGGSALLPGPRTDSSPVGTSDSNVLTPGVALGSTPLPAVRADQAPTVTLLAGFNGSSGVTNYVPLNFTVPSDNTEVVIVWAIGGQSTVWLPFSVTTVASYDTAQCCGSGGVAIGLLSAGTYSPAFADLTGSTTAFSVAVYGIADGASYGYSGAAANESTSVTLGSGALVYLGAEGTGGYYGVNASSLTTVDEASPGLIQGLAELIGRQGSPEFNFTTAGASYGIAAVGVFTQEYPLQFTESGLPSETAWGVTLSNGQAEQTNGTSISLEVPNGTYVYHAYAVASYVALPPSGSATISGAGASLTVLFEPTYTVSFSESGVPASYPSWSVTLGSTRNVAPDGSPVAFVVPNGTYAFEVGSLAGLVASPASGSVVVAGGAVAVSIDFTVAPGYYALTVSEVGLPPSTSWSIDLEGTHTDSGYETDQSTLPIYESNGTYSFLVFPALGSGPSYTGLYYPHPATGTVVVDGANVSLALTYAPPPLYPITFVAHGLPTGTTWWLNLSSGADLRTTASSLVVNLTNGSYNYSVGISFARGVAYSAPGGTVTGGAAQTVTLAFAVVHAVTFVEKGLPAGAPWTVAVGGALPVGTVNSSVRLLEPAGTYVYEIASGNSSYRPTVAEGLVTVHNGGVTKHVKFDLVTFPLLFTESGLPAHTKWCIEGAAGKERCTTGASIAYLDPNGSYAYQALSKRVAYVAANGTANVSGSALLVAVNFTEPVYSITFVYGAFDPGSDNGVVRWGVGIGDQVQETSTSTELVLYEPSGTYDFKLVESTSTLVIDGHGTVTVNGADVVVQITGANFS